MSGAGQSLSLDIHAKLVLSTNLRLLAFYVVACLAVDCLAGSAVDSYRADNNSELSCEEFCAGILNDTTDMNEADFEEQWIQRMTTTIAAAAPAAGLKFHIYDHCPFCIRGALD